MHALGGVVVQIFGSDDISGRGTLFQPFLKSIENAVGFAPRARMARLAEPIRAGTRETVLHSGDHVQANEAVGILLAHLGNHSLVIVDCVDWRDRRIVPAVVENELAAATLETTQVGIGRVENGRSFLVGHGFSGINIG